MHYAVYIFTLLYSLLFTLKKYIKKFILGGIIYKCLFYLKLLYCFGGFWEGGFPINRI